MLLVFARTASEATANCFFDEAENDSAVDTTPTINPTRGLIADVITPIPNDNPKLENIFVKLLLYIFLWKS